MTPEEYKLLHETYQLARENNQLIRSMRRGAFLRSVVTVIFYVVFFGAPIWIYLTYFGGTLDKIINSANLSQSSKASQSSSSVENSAAQLAHLQQLLQAFQRSVSNSSSTPAGQ